MSLLSAINRKTYFMYHQIIILIMFMTSDVYFIIMLRHQRYLRMAIKTIVIVALKGTAILMISMLNQKELYKP